MAKALRKNFKLLLKLEEELSAPLLSGAAVGWCSSVCPRVWGWANAAFRDTGSDSMMPIHGTPSALWALGCFLEQPVPADAGWNAHSFSAMSLFQCFFFCSEMISFTFVVTNGSVFLVKLYQSEQNQPVGYVQTDSSELGFHGFLPAISWLCRRPENIEWCYSWSALANVNCLKLSGK